MNVFLTSSTLCDFPGTFSGLCKNILDFSDDLQEHQHFWEMFFFIFFHFEVFRKKEWNKNYSQNKSSSQSEDNRKQRSGMKCIIKNDRV